jgi:hypothetical protein
VTAWRAALLGMLLCAPGALCCPATARAQGEGGATALTVQTVPVLEGVRFMVGGRTFRTNAFGRALVKGPAPRLADRIRIPDTEVTPGVRARFNRRKEGRYLLDLLYPLRMSFRDPAGRPVNSSRVSSVTLRSSHGVRRTMNPGRPSWLQGVRVVTTRQGYKTKRVTWVVENAIIDGSNVVNRSQQRFDARNRHMRVELLLYTAHFSGRDALLKFPLGSQLRIEYPNGRVERHDLGDDAEVTLPSLPRGEYVVSVEGPGIRVEQPVALSREQTVDLEVLSYLDLGLSLGVLASLALGLVLLGRPHLVRAPVGLTTRLSRGSRPTRRGFHRPRGDGLGDAPTLRDSMTVAAIAALAFGVLVVVLFGRDASVAAVLAVFMFVVTLPLTYVTAKAAYKSRPRTPEAAGQTARRRRRQDRLGQARTRRDP